MITLSRVISLRGLRCLRVGLAPVVLALTVQAAGAAQPPAAQIAQPSRDTAGTVTPLVEARDWFLRMQRAAAGTNFRGTMVFSSGGAVSSSRVTHYAVDGQVYEMLEALDGQQRRVARHDNLVHMLLPQTKVAVVENRQTLAAWSTTPQRIDPAALAHYELRREADDRVAGRTAAVFWVQPRDTLRYAQRFWVDRETALLLRADVLARQASPAPGSAVTKSGAAAPTALEWQVLESTAFSALELNVPASPQQVLQAMTPGPDYRIVRPQQSPTTLDEMGWQLTRPVPGFRLAASVMRGMDGAGARSPVLHAMFTDGLTLVSVFVENYDAQVHRSEALGQQGATASLSQRRGEHWFTVVGDVPPSALGLFVAAFDRRGP